MKILVLSMKVIKIFREVIIKTISVLLKLGPVKYLSLKLNYVNKIK